ncbi:poly-gamma-glutamate synthase PgsB [Geosporobacter ferrireducens]|uniref:Poly-gamma-glutamate synthase PgsB n=1 Tax=Geosporobacter ferrireducens TaxID=1424294 RepID=A0A1D8GMA0_9FIRM|nr:poly-gamma-glutamate synthase PgsB [Geosporobacter ferrireducens]AOT71922.1 poly-gamma-glutamate synthase PgsB [Geosporobacter ferrireducens]MTI55711.1 poly-gamma-glutamate synthase PgsB [Geosporobacter ferrireducens]
MQFAIVLIIFVFSLGIYEQIKHNKNLNCINLRINVNGTRGKSTATRLITGILKEAGAKVVGKTTGTSARIIYWNKEEEEPIKRGRLGPNIIEQKKVIKKVAKLGASAFVTECMAVNPDYQITFQEKLVKANIGVIVNVREDHMDLCGPTLDFIAESFTATIPQNGTLIVANSSYNDYFTQEAKKRNSRIIIANEKEIPDGYLEKFRYVIFPENIAIALAVAKALNIDKDIALSGMLNANPDPGALMIHPLDEENPTYFVNAFAANDPNSTLMIWNHITAMGYPTENPMVIVNCRPDRVDRTLQMAEDVLPNMKIDILVAMGESVKSITEGVNAKKISPQKYINADGLSPHEVYELIKDYLINRTIFGVGNIHGGGEELVELIIHEEFQLEADQMLQSA